MVLAVSSALAVPMECLPACGFQALLQAEGPCRQDTFIIALLDWCHSCVLYILNNTGILLNAVLSGAGAAPWMRDGWRWHMDSARYSASVHSKWMCRYICAYYFVSGPWLFCAW